MSTDPDTIAFYQARAPHWVFHSGAAHSHQLDAFLARLPAGARVLELGCGGGRDADHMRRRGCVVDATDAAPAIVRRANEAFALGARVMAFHELEARAAYHGIWAHASLLHCPRASLPDVLARIARALVPGGWHFASFKLGSAEGRDRLGRLHNFPAPEWLIAAYRAAGLVIAAQEIYAAPSSDGTHPDWIDLTVSKPLKYNIEAVCTGTVQILAGSPAPTAIAKTAQPGKVAVLPLGLAGDHQADKRHHGGPEMAVHLYPLDHHEWWRSAIGAHDLLAAPGAFGSNLAVRGITEDMVQIGDRFRVGSALLEISQPRKPCVKIEQRFGVPRMVAQIIASARCGWYFRVIEPGEVAQGDCLERVASGAAGWDVARAFRALHGRGASSAELAELAALPALSPEMRARAAARAAT